MPALYFFIPSVSALFSISAAELAIHGETSTNETKTQVKTQPLITETKTRKCSK